MRLLTKSRFKLALECPNKLYYTGKGEYANTKSENDFLMALAEGGFQVEELARMHFPGGEAIESLGKEGEYLELWETTRDLLKRENVVIFEAAFLFEGLYVKTDILVKMGKQVRLIEVKSKSYNPGDEYVFVGKMGGLDSKWKPYLFDVAFQHYVVQKCYPDFIISDYLMLADKSKRATVDGLNQRFRLVKKKDRTNRTGIEKRVHSLAETGESVLIRVPVSDIVDKILTDQFTWQPNLGFEETVRQFRDAYQADRYFGWPPDFSACKACEFKTGPGNEDTSKSGFRECYKRQLHWREEDFHKPNILEIWDFRQGGKLFKEGIYFMDQLNPELIKMKEEAGSISRTERQWIQVEKAVKGDMSYEADREGLREEMASWRFPLHFIDFETSTVALPFHRGMSPYESVAFQFSHHRYNEDGHIEHATEYLNTAPGVFPNFDFLRRLKDALEPDEGTIFRYASHENTILNHILSQLALSDEPDKEELTAFIESITHEKDSKGAFIRQGDRDMVDLRKVILDYYYNPFTGGSNSMKNVLPAILKSSFFLQQKYSLTLAENGVGSLNFGPDYRWLIRKDGEVQDPYKSLPGILTDWTEEEIEASLSGMEDIRHGGAAMTAYAYLQFTDMEDWERASIQAALKRYCELDTLAMVMVYEHLKECTMRGPEVRGAKKG